MSVAEWGVLLRGTGHLLDWTFLGRWYLKELFVNQVLPAGVGSDAMRALRCGRITGHVPMVASLIGQPHDGLRWGCRCGRWPPPCCCAARCTSPAFAGFVAFAAAMVVAWLALLADGVRALIPEHRRLSYAAARLLQPFTSAFDAYRCRPRIVTQSIAAGAVGWGMNSSPLQAFALALGSDQAWTVFAPALPIALLATFAPSRRTASGCARACWWCR